MLPDAVMPMAEHVEGLPNSIRLIQGTQPEDASRHHIDATRDPITLFVELGNQVFGDVLCNVLCDLSGLLIRPTGALMG